MNDMEDFQLQMGYAAVGVEAFVKTVDNRLEGLVVNAPVEYFWQSPADVISRFLNGEFSRLCQAFECLKRLDPIEAIESCAERIAASFFRLSNVASKAWKKFKLKTHRDFARCARLVQDAFRSKFLRARAVPTVFASTVSPVVFRRIVIDRIVEIIRTALVDLRDALREIDFLVPRRPAPIQLGAHAAGFVVRADRENGVLELRQQDGNIDALRITSQQAWDAVLQPLLTSEDPQGHAALRHDFHGLLVRLDAQGNERNGDLKRLKSYIHPVGRGRAGNGLYFLAPYPRPTNTVDR